jgi:hypothetical protein
MRRRRSFSSDCRRTGAARGYVADLRAQRLYDRSTTAAHDQGDDEQDEENEKQNPRDGGEITGKATEAEHAGEQREDGENKREAEHTDSSFRESRRFFEELPQKHKAGSRL